MKNPKNKQWQDAIPVIKEIIDRNPKIDTSWFNYGVCLEKIGDYPNAVKAFIKAHELNVKDYGIHYRIIRSMYLAKDYKQMLEFIDYICLTFEDEVDVIFESDEFPKIQNLDKYLELKNKYYNKKS